MHKILYILKTLEAFYQGKHWTAKGSNFYNEHIFFGELYKTAGLHIDKVAELALANDISEILISTPTILESMLNIYSSIEDSSPDYFSNNIRKAIILEEVLLNKIESMMVIYNKDSGVNNLLTTIAEQHKSNLYLLKRHLK